MSFLDWIGLASIILGLITVCAVAAGYMLCQMRKQIAGFPTDNEIAASPRYDWQSCPEPRAPKHPDGVFAYAGDVIVCDGREPHEIATFTVDVKVGELYSPGALGNWLQPAPVLGELTENLRCATCGAPWTVYGNHFRFKDGWR